jgi:hypothetical protein
VLRGTTSRGLCGLVCPSRTSERGGDGTREEPGTLTQGGALFSLVPLVWKSNPKLQGGWCKPNHQPIGGSDPNHQGIHCGVEVTVLSTNKQHSLSIWCPPRAGHHGRERVFDGGLSSPPSSARDMGGHVLRETTSRGLCGLVCPSRTSERGGEGDPALLGSTMVGACIPNPANPAASSHLT